MQQKLASLLNKRLALPVAPQAIARVIQSFEDPNASADDLAWDIADDPVLTGRLLKAANSAYFGLGRKVNTPREALDMLGFNKVRALAMATAVQASFHHVQSTKLDAVWQVSLEAADIALTLAGLLRLDKGTAYTAGMLHAVGMLVMASGLPEQVDALDAQIHPMDIFRADAERDRFGYCHAEAGAALMVSWRLPSCLVDAVQHQYSPWDNDRHEVLAGVLNLAGWRARAEYCGLDRSAMATTYPDEVGLILNLDHDMMMGDIPGRGLRVTEEAERA